MTPEKCPFDEALEWTERTILLHKAAISTGASSPNVTETISILETIRTALIAARDDGKATAEQQAEAALIEGMHTGDFT